MESLCTRDQGWQYSRELYGMNRFEEAKSVLQELLPDGPNNYSTMGVVRLLKEMAVKEKLHKSSLFDQ
jgi:hypothetical protein